MELKRNETAGNKEKNAAKERVTFAWVHGEDGPVMLHFFYALNPPPPGPLEDADIEDEDDYYGQ